jgi:hypothetical protein
MPVALPPSGELSGLPPSALGPYARLIERLFAGRNLGRMDVPMDDAALAVLSAYKEQCMREAALFEPDLPRYSERLLKTWSEAARVALAFATVEFNMKWMDVNPRQQFGVAPELITARDMERAVAYCRWQSAHDLLFYTQAAKRDDLPALVLARKVGEHLLADEKQEFKLGDLTSRVLEWRNADDNERYAAIQLLEQLDWVWTRGAYFVGRTFKAGHRWKVNPRVHVEHRAKAEAVRAVNAAKVQRIAEAVQERRAPL